MSLLAVLLVAGCSNRQVQQKLKFAEQTVQQSLEEWKSGGSPADLKLAEPPVDFHDDDWRAGAKLIDFEIRKIYLEPSDQTARCSATLTIQRRNEKTSSEVKCTYQVVSEPEVIVARDPMS